MMCWRCRRRVPCRRWRDTGAAVCLMHMQGTPRTMQAEPHYDDVVARGGAFLRQRAQACIAAGIAGERIVLDPGFGFGKTLQHNLQLLRRPAAACWRTGFRCWSGLSRKSMLGKLLGPAGGTAAGRQPGAGHHRGAARCAHHPQPRRGRRPVMPLPWPGRPS